MTGAYTYTGPMWLPGIPEPKGSMTRIPPARPGGKPRWINDNPRYDNWEETMVAAMRLYARTQKIGPLDVPVELVADFYLPRKPSTKFRDAPIGTGSGDLDKLVRGVGDAIKKAGLYTDDARITRIVAEKMYAIPPQKPGARVELLPYTPPPVTPHGPLPVRLVAGRHNRLVGSISRTEDMPCLLRQVADEWERNHATT